METPSAAANTTIVHDLGNPNAHTSLRSGTHLIGKKQTSKRPSYSRAILDRARLEADKIHLTLKAEAIARRVQQTSNDAVQHGPTRPKDVGDRHDERCSFVGVPLNWGLSIEPKIGCCICTVTSYIRTRDRRGLRNDR